MLTDGAKMHEIDEHGDAIECDNDEDSDEYDMMMVSMCTVTFVPASSAMLHCKHVPT